MFNKHLLLMMRYRRCIWNTIWINTIQEKCGWSSNKHESLKINASAAWAQGKDKTMPFTLLQHLPRLHVTFHEAIDTEKCSLNDFWVVEGNPRDCNITKATEELECHSCRNRWTPLTIDEEPLCKSITSSTMKTVSFLPPSLLPEPRDWHSDVPQDR